MGQLRQHLNHSFYDETIRCMLHRLGYVWKRPHYVLAADAQREKKRHIRHVLGCLPQRSVVLAEDETDLLLFPRYARCVPCEACRLRYY
jgi:hypothetical protein